MAKQIKIIFKCFLCLALGVLVLQGCQTGNYISKSDILKSINAYNNPIKTNTKKIYSMYSDEEICERYKMFAFKSEAVRRGLDCGVEERKKIKTIMASKQIKDLSKRPLASVSDTSVCYNATITSSGSKVWNDRNENFVGEAKYRGLDCGVNKKSKTIIAGNKDIADSIWTFYEDDGDVRLFLFRKDNTFKYKNLKTYYHMGKVFGNDDERWSITDNVVLISFNSGYNKIYLNINDTRDVMKGIARNKKGKVQGVIGKLEKKEVIFKNGDFFKYRKPSPKIISKNVAETKKIKIKYADISKPKITKPSISSAEQEKQKTKEFNLSDLECFFAFSDKANCRVKRLSNLEICEYIKGYKRGVETYDNYYGSLKEAKRRGLNCGVGIKTQTITASKSKKQTFTKPIISSAELDAERQKRIELERKLAVMEAKQKQEQQRIDNDTRVPLLEIISNKTQGKRGTVHGFARDNVEVAEVTVNGKPIYLSSNGKFKFNTYVPPTGKKLKIEVTDISGLTSSKIITLKGNKSFVDNPILFDDLNPLGKRVKPNKNSLALIVGVSNYENTKSRALYADNDALVFKDYASEKLGVPENRIKILINDGADEKDILLSVQDWIRRTTKPNKSDIYIFFAGHGLASDDGKKMYLLPHDGSPRLLDDTAILRDRLFSDLKASNPKSVTVFLDTCYSGVTRNEEMLIAGRPIVIKSREQAIPDGFTIFSAASNEQISRPLEEAKHGMFSYFLMKGMEGDADVNNDNKVTVLELHNFVRENVVQQSSGSQTPELQGDGNRVLVQFN